MSGPANPAAAKVLEAAAGQPMRTCTRCGQCKPLSAFSGRREHRCKPCNAERARQARYAKRPELEQQSAERALIAAAGAHRCGSCGGIFPRDCFVRRSNRPCGIVSMCKRCKAASRRPIEAAQNAANAVRYRDVMTDNYVEWCLYQSTGIKPGSNDPALIEAKREHLRLVRLLKEKAK